MQDELAAQREEQASSSSPPPAKLPDSPAVEESSVRPEGLDCDTSPRIQSSEETGRDNALPCPPSPLSLQVPPSPSRVVPSASATTNSDFQMQSDSGSCNKAMPVASCEVPASPSLAVAAAVVSAEAGADSAGHCKVAEPFSVAPPSGQVAAQPQICEPASAERPPATPAAKGVRSRRQFRLPCFCGKIQVKE